MNILLAAKCPPNGPRKIGGVQSWCNTVASELVRLGHRVFLWGPGQNAKGHCDLGIIANRDYATPILKKCDKRLFVCHGIIDAERPPPKGEMVVFTSEGVREFWHGVGPIVRQPIDLEFWRPKECERKYLTRFSYRRGLEYLPRIAKDMKLEFKHVRNLSPEAARDIIQHSVCVVATGRAAVESMACDVPVVICDHRSSYQGPLLDPNPYKSMYQNYSGRGGLSPSYELLSSHLRAATQAGGMREHVRKHHDSVKIVDKLLRLVPK